MQKLLIAIPLIALLALGSLYIITHHKKEDLQFPRNQTTIFEWYSCFNEKTQHECEELADEAEKTLCNTAANLVGRYTYDGSSEALKPCQQFHDFMKTANITDQINTENYYEDCYLSTQVLKTAYQSAFYNDTIYYPLYVRCAGF